MIETEPDKKTGGIFIICEGCWEETLLAFAAIEADNRFVCPHCGTINILDVEHLRERRQKLLEMRRDYRID